jgi:hypothetical protein
MQKLALSLRRKAVSQAPSFVPYASAGVVLAYKFRDRRTHSILFVNELRRKKYVVFSVVDGEAGVQFRDGQD